MQLKRAFPHVALLSGFVVDGVAVVAFLTDGVKVIGEVTLHWPVFLFAGTVLISLVTPYFGNILWQSRKAVRLSNMTGDLIELRGRLNMAEGAFQIVQHQLLGELLDVKASLELQFGILSPNTQTSDLTAWYDFVCKLIPLARNRDLKRARHLGRGFSALD